jgi:4-carboxymuconolactone decarboxylase
VARVSLIIEQDHPELATPIEVLKKGRRGALINVYRLLLHSPDVAMGWFELLNAVRFKTLLSDRVREIVIIRIAILNGVSYVVSQHVPTMALEAGLTPAECEALSDWRAGDCFDATERAVLAYTDAMTTNVQVPDDVYAAVAVAFDERRMVELTVLAAAYNMHTRVLAALKIDSEAHHQPDGPSNG